jgi:hypothetical protein
MDHKFESHTKIFGAKISFETRKTQFVRCATMFSHFSTTHCIKHTNINDTMKLFTVTIVALLSFHGAAAICEVCGE